MTPVDAVFAVLALTLAGIAVTTRNAEPHPEPAEDEADQPVPPHLGLPQLAARFRGRPAGRLPVAGVAGGVAGVVDAGLVRWALGAGLPEGLVVAHDLAVPAR